MYLHWIIFWDFLGAVYFFGVFDFNPILQEEERGLGCGN